jgi:hypothetical protein
MAGSRSSRSYGLLSEPEMLGSVVSRPSARADRKLLTNIGVVTAAVVLVASIMTQSGRIADNQGYGFDGTTYARMMVDALYRGTDNTRMRPLVLLTNQLAYDFVFKEPILTFQAMNLVYTAALALVLCGILDVYGALAIDKVIFTVNVFASIAIAKMFAFYPVLIDLGAYTWIALAVYAIIRGYRPLIIVATILAVLAREFGLVVLAFGLHRDMRRGVPVPIAIGTYLPALIIFGTLRQWVLATSTTRGEPGGGLLGVADAVANLRYLADPLFLIFLAYFVATIFGGISLLLVVRFFRGRLPLRGETEWLTYFGAVALLTACGNIDLWRYLAYSLPAVAAVYAMTLSGSDWRVMAPWAAVATLFTQQPWTEMNDTSYFREWFPLYIPELDWPDPPQFWVGWVIRLAGVACLGIFMWRVQARGELNRTPTGAPTETTV